MLVAITFDATIFDAILLRYFADFRCFLPTMAVTGCCFSFFFRLYFFEEAIYSLIFASRRH